MKRFATLTTAGLVCITAPLVSVTGESAAGPEQDVIAAMGAFVQAFENGDIAAMEASFADDATDFPRAIMSNEARPRIRISDYRRVRGLDPQMRALVAGWRESDASPPYMTLEPRDLEVRVFGDAALVTFHLEHDNSLGRRSFVLAKRQGVWKIVHLHASNVVGAE